MLTAGREYQQVSELTTKAWVEHRSAAVASLIVIICLFLVTEVLYRMSGGLPSAPPGMTTTEFLWKMKNIDFRKAVLIVGDSRVGWGFSQDAFNDELQRLGISNISGFNGGMAGTGVEYTIKSIVESETGKKHLPRLKGNNQTAPRTPGSRPKRQLM